jgi:signal transduction histidine kinase
MAGRDRLGIAAAAAGLLSLAFDAVVLARGDPYPQGMTTATRLGVAEVVVLLVLTVLALRWSQARVAITAGTLAGLAVPLWLLRFGLPAWSAESVGGYAGWGMLAMLAVAVGLYLRALDERRTRGVMAARRAQQLELADDLHDFVVHDINEMLLQAQAGQVLLGARARDGDGDRLGADVGMLLRRIEGTALRALQTVDRAVHLLHRAESFGELAETTADGAPRSPQPTVDDLPELVDRFTATGMVAARLDIEPGLARTPVQDEGRATAQVTVPTLPPEVSATVYRIVVEALTNVRRHARDATRVRVTVAREPGDGVRVEIADDGTAQRPTRRRAGPCDPSRLAGTRRGASGRGGLGLAGLTNRVGALGGTLSTGPTEPTGWQVRAVLPMRTRYPADSTAR